MKKVYREATFAMMIVMIICTFGAGMAIAFGRMGAFYALMAAVIISGAAAWLADGLGK